MNKDFHTYYMLKCREAHIFSKTFGMEVNERQWFDIGPKEIIKRNKNVGKV